MGKLYLWIAVASIFGGVVLLAGVQRVGFETSRTQSSYQENVLAREIAQSGFNVAVGEVKRDYEGYRPNAAMSSYRGGTFDIAVTGSTEGPVEVASVGRYGTAPGHRVHATLERDDDFLDAVTIGGPLDKMSASGTSYVITGMDTNPIDGIVGAGPLGDKHAIRTRLESAVDKVSGAVQATRVYGAGGLSDVVSGPSTVDLDTLVDSVFSHPSTVTYTGDQIFGSNMRIGSAGDPATIVVNGNVKLTDNVLGYGALFVDGEFVMSKDARWEGLVVVRPDGNDLELEGRSTIFGALVTLPGASATAESDDLGLPGGHFDIDVFDGVTTNEEYHQHQYDDKFDLTYVDLLSPGCGDAGLCFGNIVGTKYPEIRAQFINTGSSSGSFEFEADGVSQSGSPAGGFSATFDPSKLTRFKVDFDNLCALRGTSPGDVQGNIGTRDNAFSVRLYETATNTLVYELSVYHHIKKGEECDGDDEEDDGIPATTPFQFKIGDDASVYYSSTALMRLSEKAPIIDLGRISVRSIREQTLSE